MLSFANSQKGTSLACEYTEKSVVDGDGSAPFYSAKKFIRVAGLLLFVFAAFVAIASDDGLSEKLLDYVSDKYGSRAKSRLLDWEALIKNNKDEDEATKLEMVNEFFNQIRFISDQKHWNKEDYWATPVEMLATNGGDCEDFSIAKYFTLKEMGVSVSKMLITYVKAVELNQAHMVLTYYKTESSEPLVLDNLMDEIKPASQRKDLVPVYSFNGDGLWLSKERGKGTLVGSASRISLWGDLGLRMEKEGPSFASN